MSYDVEIIRHVMSFVFNTKDPLFKEELQDVLREKGYTIDKPISYKGKNIAIQDLKVAHHNDSDIIYDSNAPALFIVGKNPEIIFKEFNDLKDVLVNDLGIELDELIKSFEMISENRVKSKKPPQKVIDDYYKDCMPKKFDKILGEDNTLFTIHIVPKGKTPLSSNWHDLLIRSASPRHYYVRFVYRNNKLQAFKDMSEKSMQVITKSLEVLEEN